MVGLFRIIEGIALLTLGRKLFWLFVGLIGFEAGTQFAGRMFVAMPEWMTLLIAIAVGLLGAILAIFLQGDYRAVYSRRGDSSRVVMARTAACLTLRALRFFAFRFESC